jgi:hypothetical protein
MLLLYFSFAHLAAAHLVAANGWNWPGLIFRQLPNERSSGVTNIVSSIEMEHR